MNIPVCPLLRRPTSAMAIVSGVLACLLLILGASMPAAAQNTPQPPRANPEAAIALHDRFEELLRILNGDFDRLKPELFSAAFREQMPVGMLGDAMRKQYAQMRGFKKLGGNPANPYEMHAWLRSVSDGKDWDLVLGIETQRPYAIDALTLEARPARATRAYDGWTLLDRDLETLVERSGFALHEILPDGTTRVVHRYQADRRMAIGLASQIWLLGSVVEKVNRGEATWDQMLPLKRSFKSLPALGFGVTPEGFEFRLHEFAQRMMANQDTTAFDHLLNFVGRPAVESLKASDRQGPDGPGSVFGAAASPENPFLSTLDLYRLTCSVDATAIKRFASGDTALRRDMVEQTLPRTEVMFELFEVWAKPQELESVGWFATADELCRAGARIWRFGQDPAMRPATLDPIRAHDNPATDLSAFKYVGISAGGVPGAFAGTWLYERLDGRVFVMTFLFNNPTNILNQEHITPIIEASQALVGRMQVQPTN